MSWVRLQRFLAQAGIASRREAEKRILEGQVQVNGILVRELGSKVDPDVDKVYFQGRRVRPSPKLLYYLFHKPAGVMVTKKDPEGRKTVFQMIPRLDPSVNSVGRLDQDSEGLLLLTNDGELQFRLTHPSYEVEKVYEIQLKALPPPEELKRLERGIELDEGRTAPAKIRILKKQPQVWLSIQIHEGKKRQIRRMFEGIGSKVVRLIRVQMGPITLGSLPLGKWRKLSEKEVLKLKRAARLIPIYY